MGKEISQIELDSIVRIPCKLDISFFRYWILFLKPFHNLTDREIDIATAFLKERYDLSKVISDNSLLETILMNEDSKKKIRELCNITAPHFQVIMGKLRKNKFIIDNKINPRYIPTIVKEKNNNFKMLLLFDFT